MPGGLWNSWLWEPRFFSTLLIYFGWNPSSSLALVGIAARKAAWQRVDTQRGTENVCGRRVGRCIVFLRCAEYVCVTFMRKLWGKGAIGILTRSQGTSIPKFCYRWLCVTYCNHHQSCAKFIALRTQSKFLGVQGREVFFLSTLGLIFFIHQNHILFNLIFIFIIFYSPKLHAYIDNPQLRQTEKHRLSLQAIMVWLITKYQIKYCWMLSYHLLSPTGRVGNWQRLGGLSQAAAEDITRIIVTS